MDRKRKIQLDAYTKIIKSLAHPARILIVQELQEGERCVCELTQVVGSEMSTVSKHLSLLKNAGIIEDDKRGTQVFYRLKTPCILNFLRCVHSVLMESNEERMELVQLSK